MIFVGFWRTFFSVFVVNITRCFSLFYFLTLFSLFESNCNKTVSGLFSCLCAVFTEDFAKAQTQVMSNSVVGQIIEASGSEEGIDWVGILDYILGNGASKAPAENGSAGIVFKSGTLSLGCDELVLEDENPKDGDENSIKYVFSDISVTVTPLEDGTISIGVQVSFKGDTIRDNISGKIVIDETDGPTFVPDGEISSEIAEIKYIVDNASFYSAKDINIGATDFVVGLSAIVLEKISIPATVSVNGSIVLSMKTVIAKNEEGKEVSTLSGISVNVKALDVKVDAGALGNVSASIKDLDFELAISDFSTSLSISEVSLSGALLPMMDNIRFKAGMKGFEFGSTGMISIDSMEATVLGYENISVAAKVEGFNADTSTDTDEVLISFSFAAAVSFEDQKIGIRGEWGKDLDPTDVSTFITIAVLNGAPVEPNSLFELIVRVVLPSTDGDGTTV